MRGRRMASERAASLAKRSRQLTVRHTRADRCVASRKSQERAPPLIICLVLRCTGGQGGSVSAVEQVGRAHGVGGGGLHGQVRPWPAPRPYPNCIQTAARSAAYTARRRQNEGSMLTLCAHLSARAARGRLTWAWRTRWSPASRERRRHRAARPTSTFLSLQWSFLLIEAVIHDNLWPSRTPWAPGG